MPIKRILVGSLATLLAILFGTLFLSLSNLGGDKYPAVAHANVPALQASGSWQIISNMTTPRYWHTAVVTGNYLYVLGGRPAPTPTNDNGVSSVERAVVNSDGSLGTWQVISNMTVERYSFAAVQNNGYLYAIAGHDNSGNYLSSVERATINADGSLGSWQVISHLVKGRYGLAAVVAGNYLYALGGYTGTWENSVERALINPDGSLGTWQLISTMNQTREALAAVYFGGYLYAIGGHCCGSTFRNTVERAAVNGDGSLGSWQAMSSMTSGRTWLAALVQDGYLYAFGGYNGSSESSVERALLNADGSLGSWQVISNMTVPRGELAVIATAGYFYAIGGLDDPTTVYDSVERVSINDLETPTTVATSISGTPTLMATGTITATQTNTPASTPSTPTLTAAPTDTPLTTTSTPPTNTPTDIPANTPLTPTLPSPTDTATSTPSGSMCNSTNTPPNTPAPTTQSFGAWKFGPSLLIERHAAAAIAVQGHLYAIGGDNNSGILCSVEMARINPDGSLGPWQETTPLLTARGQLAAVTANGYIYAIGGDAVGYDAGGDTNIVERARINADGSLDPWQAMSSMTSPRANLAAVTVGGYIYALGGQHGTNSVERTAIHPDGSLGPWQETSSMVSSRYVLAGVTANGYVYAIGGYDCCSRRSVERAAINPDGSLGSWEMTTSMNTGRCCLAAVSTGGFIYALGGHNGAEQLNTVERAAINADGSLGAWQDVAPMNNTRLESAAATTGDYIYVLGGGLILDSVEWASVNSLTLNTFPGTNVSITNNAGATVTFTTVSMAGQTTISASNSGPIPPSGFSLAQPTFYDISTTASYSSPVAVCLTYDPAQYSDLNLIRLLHFENNSWLDVTTSNDTTNDLVCGQVNSLSPFLVAQKQFAFSGFFAPVNNLPTLNVAKAGSSIPVKFSLGGNQGLNIFPSGYPVVKQIDCDTGAPEDAIEQTVTAGSSSLSYEATADRYTYVWKTDKGWVGTCRKLVIRLSDGTNHSASFKFTK